MRRFFAGFISFYIFCNSPAFAAPINLQTGEHPNFTRVVIQIPEGRSWEITERETQAIISINGHVDGFDTSRIFATIPKTRIVDFSADNSQLFLEIDCECALRYFFEQDQYLVVDILDTEFEQAAVPQQYEPSNHFGYGNLLWKPDGENESSTEKSQTRNEDETEQNPNQREDLFLQAQAQLLKSFSRAVARGDIKTKDQVSNEIEPTQNSEFPETSGAAEAPKLTQDLKKKNIRVTDSRSNSLKSVQELDHSLSLSGLSCPDASIVDISSWGGSENFAIEISQSNRSIYSDAGNLESSEVLRRARMFIFFGFGSEALQTLQMLPSLSETHPELYDLAAIMETGYAQNPRFVHLYSECASDLALWALLAPRTISPDLSLESGSVLQAIEKLPPHIRHFIGEEASRRLVQIGNFEGANIALRSSTRMLSQDDAQPSLAQAEMNIVRGDQDTARVIMSEIITQNDSDSPHAVTQKIETYVRNGEPISADLALTVEAFAFQYRTGEISKKLERARILAAASSGQFDKAISLLLAYDLPNIKNSEISVPDHVFSELTAKADSILFLEHTLKDNEMLQNSASDETKYMVANRLLKLGFAMEANRLLTSSKPSDELALLSARINIKLNKPTEALAALENLQGPDVEVLRGSAYLLNSEKSKASTAFERAGAEEKARSANWLSVDWVDRLPASDPTFGSVREIAAEQFALIQTNNVMLQEVSRVLESSENARQTLNQLLSDFEISD